VKKWLMKIFITLLIISFCWIIFAQSCMMFRTSDSLAAEDFRQKSIPFRAVYDTIQRHTIHYVISGSDTLPTLVFIHGSPGSWNAFENYLKDSALLQHYRMISIDRPGFGYSEFGKALNLKMQCTLLTAVIKKIENGKSLVLIGHSLGGPAIVKIAAEHPELPVTNLVILAGSVDPSEEKPESWRSTLDRTPLRYLIPGAMRPSNAELLFFKEDVEAIPGDLKKVTCRVLIMHGDKDTFVPPGNATFAQQNLTNAKEVKLVWFKDEKHFIPWTKFKDIRDALLQLNMN
jgi:pimeloyl-ACP methyl ester carboxylesterase